MADQDTNQQKKVVLVVEDDAFLLKFYVRAFELNGMQVTIAHDGEEGLQAILDQKPDFVILDILMPKIDGLQVLKKVREEHDMKDLPVMIITNYDLPEYRKTAADLGVIDYVLKISADPMAIVKRVKEYLGIAQGAKAASAV
jgi:DNA-binding response OmpR family regulator